MKDLMLKVAVLRRTELRLFRISFGHSEPQQVYPHWFNRQSVGIELVSDEPAAAAGEDGRTARETRAVLLASAGREPSDAAAVWKHGAEDRGAAPAERIGRGGRASKQVVGRKGTERCVRNRLK